TKSIENVQSEIETIPSKVNDQQEQESTTVNTDNKSGVIE
ncbi:unnamed protein product, partial [Rotaria magnacalcarata]